MMKVLKKNEVTEKTVEQTESEMKSGAPYKRIVRLHEGTEGVCIQKHQYLRRSWHEFSESLLQLDDLIQMETEYCVIGETETIL
ncbi:unnamed protein product [Schistosoma curassoni]|nr:unnamed protein product [Schistosoma curassoni]